MNTVARLLIGILISLTTCQTFADCSSPTGLIGALRWDSTANKMKVCSGTTWIDTVATAGGACAVANGTVNYSSGDLRYCYNSVWYSMKGTGISNCVGSTAGTFKYDSTLSTFKYCNGSDNNWYRVTNHTGPFGYFVRTATKFNGNHGGLAGANARCLTELTSASVYWKGKDDAGTLTANRVKAWLCDATNCQNPKPYSVYKASAASLTGPNTSTPGGANIVINSSGIGPGNADDWSGATFFGDATAYWTGRSAGSATDWGNSVSSTHCQNWTNSTGGQSGMPGIGSTTATRWNRGTTNSCGTAISLICMVNPDPDPGKANDCGAGCTEIILTNTALSTWTVPADWNDSNNKIEVIGGGGGGLSGIPDGNGGGGGGGGAYGYALNVNLTPGATVNISIGTGGTGGASPTAGGSTRFGGTDLASSIVGANGGAAGGNPTGGTGGTFVNGTYGYVGGSGGQGKISSGSSGGGGGGGAGPLGPGGNGGGPPPMGSGSGGGGNGGGTVGGAGDTIQNGISGAGGNNASYTGGGAATTSNAQNGNNGTDGGGGSGCSGAATNNHAGHGSNGIEYVTKGSGGGGGGGCWANSSPAGNGGNGGIYGGGGGGGGSSTLATDPVGIGGSGGQGMIRITYTP